MFSALIKRAEEQLSEKLPFVLYRKPNLREINGIFQDSRVLHLISDFGGSGFVFAPFDGTRASILIPANEKLTTADFDSEPLVSSATFIPDTSQQDAHINLIKKGIAEIERETFKKVVLSRRFKVDVTANPIMLFQKLLQSYISAFCYLWYHPQVGIWLGATPEILLRAENDLLTTMSLAGTQVYDNEDTVKWAKKELEEQALVTEYIKNTLNGKVANLKTSALESLRAGNLLHLRTKLSGRMNTDLGSIIKALHPTPAVCGMPMQTAKEFIMENEGYDREYYTGFLGELNFRKERQRTLNRKNQENQVYRSVKTSTELFVNLRCMQLLQNHALIYVGGGITGDSDARKEWEETVSKSSTILNIVH